VAKSSPVKARVRSQVKGHQGRAQRSLGGFSRAQVEGYQKGARSEADSRAQKNRSRGKKGVERAKVLWLGAEGLQKKVPQGATASQGASRRLGVERAKSRLGRGQLVVVEGKVRGFSRGQKKQGQRARSRGQKVGGGGG